MDSLAILGKVPPTMEEKLKGLRHSLASDGVHFTEWGYHNWFCNMSDNMSRILGRMAKAKKSEDQVEIISGGNFFWRGFSSPRGSLRRPTPTPGPVRGGGRGAGRGSSRGVVRGGGVGGQAGRSGKPYDHNGQRRF